MAFVAALKQEITHLEQELAENPLFIRLQEARRLLATYESNGDASDVTGAEISRHTSTSGKSALILEIAKHELAGRPEPTPIRTIMSALLAQGVELVGATPQNTVSSLLSKSVDFVSHGRAGWTLAAQDAEERGAA